MIDADRVAEVAQLEEARSRLARLRPKAVVLPPYVPTGTSHLWERGGRAKLVTAERKREEALSAAACKRQALSRTAVVRERTPPPVPDSLVPAGL